MERVFFLLSGVYGFLGVALGAFGAHGLKTRLESLPDAALRTGWWQTGAQYHLIHALALALAAYLAGRTSATTATVAGFCFAGGVLLFSGSLYVMTLTGIRWLGAVTPLGGLLMLAGWASVALTAMKLGQ
ncbi:DUF423 domain-containing protein [Chondromyces crocatus]|uniref:Membrane protein n=1 Tax=Chondromyces crocatus TaxID=52 RepID=A0A0K1EU17_CHOCO|nr:DUF423 domain-containing protein [Chondromyces crocatus]AKT44137.1 membrane protein [Chondromyces crocatus]